MRFGRLCGLLMVVTMVSLGRVGRADDSVKVDGVVYGEKVKVVGVGDAGQLAVLIGGKERVFDWKKVEWLNVEGEGNFNKAEDARRVGKESGALYSAAIRLMGRGPLKVVAELRGAEALESEGTWLDAVGLFVDAYKEAGTQAVWNLRPGRVPADAKVVKAAADFLGEQAERFESSGEKANVLRWELELLGNGQTAEGKALAARIAELNAKARAAKFFGIEVGGKSVVFILDHSGSMLDTFDFLRQEVIGTINKLTPEQSFDVVMVSEKASLVYPKLEGATDQMKKDFAKKLNTYRAQGMNDDLLPPFQEAFEKAFAMKPDAIYFLTDGHFDPRLMDVVKKLNAEQKVKIHTVAFVNHEESYEDQLKELAKANGGKYKFVGEKDLGK